MGPGPYFVMHCENSARRRSSQGLSFSLNKMELLGLGGCYAPPALISPWMLRFRTNGKLFQPPGKYALMGPLSCVEAGAGKLGPGVFQASISF